MPNHITNITIIRGDKAKIQEVLRVVGKTMDFNKIIPMPKELKDTERAYYADEEKQKALDQKRAENKAKYGFESWYEWALANWDTKWNAYDHRKTKVERYAEDKYLITYGYLTAWSCPVAILCALSKKFGVYIDHYYADEDYGYNLGELSITNGEIIHRYSPKEGTKEAEEEADTTYDAYYEMEELENDQ